MALTEKQKQALEAYKARKSPKLGQTQESPNNSDFLAGVSSGIDQVQGTLYGVTGLIGDAVGSDSLKDFGLEGYERNVKEAQQNAPRIGRVEDIHGIGDAIDWAQGTLGQLVPSVATMIAGGGIGGAIAKKGAETAVKKLAEETIKKKVMTGQALGAGLGSVGMETGEIYGDVASEGHQGAGAIVPSIIGGTAAGALDTLPVLRVGKALGFGGELKDEIVGSLKNRIIKEGTKQAAFEGGTEGLQTTIEEATKSFITKKGLPEDMSSLLLNSVAAGALGGGVMGGTVGAIAGTEAPSQDTRGPLEKATDQLEIGNVQPGKNPVTGEDFGYADIKSIADQLRSIDEQIKNNPNATGVDRLKEKAGTLIDELQASYLFNQANEDGKVLRESQKKEAKDVYDFYKGYEGANSQAIEPIIETNDQRINRIMAEDEARVGKAEKDQGTTNEGPQNIEDAQREVLKEQQAQEIAKEVEDKQVLEAETKKLEEAINEKANEIVRPSKAPVEDLSGYFGEKKKALEQINNILNSEESTATQKEAASELSDIMKKSSAVPDVDLYLKMHEEITKGHPLEDSKTLAGKVGVLENLQTKEKIPYILTGEYRMRMGKPVVKARSFEASPDGRSASITSWIPLDNFTNHKDLLPLFKRGKMEVISNAKQNEEAAQPNGNVQQPSGTEEGSSQMPSSQGSQGVSEARRNQEEQQKAQKEGQARANVNEEILRELPEFIPPENVELPKVKETKDSDTVPVPEVKQEKAEETAAKIIVDAENKTRRDEPELEKAVAIKVQEKIEPKVEEALKTDEDPNVTKGLEVIRHMAETGKPVQEIEKALDFIIQKTGREDLRGTAAQIVSEVFSTQQGTNANQKTTAVQEPSQSNTKEAKNQPKQEKVSTKLEISTNPVEDPQYSNMSWENIKLQLSSSATFTGIKVTDLKDLLKAIGVKKGLGKMRKADIIDTLETLKTNESVLNATRSLLSEAARRKASKPSKSSGTQKRQKTARDKLEQLKEERKVVEEDPIEKAIREEAQIANEIKEPTKDGENISKEELKNLEDFARNADNPDADLFGTGLEDLSIGSYDDDFEFSPDAKRQGNQRKIDPELFAKFQRFLNNQRELFDKEGNYDSSMAPNSTFAKNYDKKLRLLEEAFNRLTSKITAIIPDVHFVFVKNLNDVPDYLKVSLTNSGIKSFNPVDLGWRGLHVDHGGITTIYMNPHSAIKHGGAVEKFKQTFLHEFVGHFGLRKLFEATHWDKNLGISKYDQFLDRIAETNPEVLRAALNMRHDWSNIKTQSPVRGPGSKSRKYIANNLNGEEVEIWVTDAARRKLLDEYLAEKAKEFSDPELVKKWTKEDKQLIKRFIAWVKHKLRSILGEHKVTDDDIMAMVAQSYDNLYGKGVIQPGLKAQRLFNSKGYSFKTMNEMSPVDFDQVQMSPEEYNKTAEEGKIPPVTKEEAISAEQKAIRDAAASGVPTKDILAAESVMASGYADVAESSVASYGTKAWYKFKETFPRLYAAFNPEGTLRNHLMKDSEAMKALGKMDSAFRMAREASDVLKTLSSAQADAVMDYFTDDRASVDMLNLPEKDKRKLIQYKEAIQDFGERFVKLGMLDPDKYYETKGKYLPARYMAYINKSLGAGRKASPMTYLMSKGNLTEEERTILGEVQDPQFIIPETISLIGRDIALMEYIETIQALSTEKDLGWILGDNKITRLDGKKMSVTRAEEMMDVWQSILDDYKGLNVRFNSTDKDIELIKKEMEFTQKQIDDYKAKLEAKIRSEAQLPLDQPIPEDEFKSALGVLYKKMPNERGYGSLRNQWVRKEIYDEFVETTIAQKDLTGITKAIAPGGPVDKFNQFWKMMKVPFNAPSWVRNAVGNMVLLDIATPTNIYKLSKMVTEEIHNALKGNPSEYWRVAHEHGLFGTTFSSNEIFLLSEINSATRAAQLAKDLREVDGTFKSNMLKARGYFMKAAEITSQAYGGLEGMFKVAAMRDYIERWKSENNVAKLEDLEKAQYDAVVNRAIHHANEAIFDYSSLTAWQKDLRRNALGAPFITYTLKALPAVTRGLARNPQKFIKYAALPSILASVALSSLGDLTPDEIEEINKNMPQWQREKSSVYIWPWRDANGKIVPVDFGYYFPWAPWQDMATKSIAKFENAEGIEDYGYAAIKASWEGANSLGLLGGPIPTSLVALLSNKDTFMNREIVSEGASAGTQLAQMFSWAYSLMAPPWMTNYGVTGKLMDHMDLSITGLPNNNVDVEGNQKETLGETMLRAVGVNTYATTPDISKVKFLREFKGKMFKLQQARSKVIKNRGLTQTQKITEIKDINRRMTLLRKKYAGE